MDLQIRLAINTETKQIIQLLKEIATWLKSEEIDQWSYLLSEGEDDEIEQAILNSETYVAEYDKKLIGTFTISSILSEWDLNLWGNQVNRSLYLHRLAIDIVHKGNGWGYEIIRWIEEEFSGQYMYLRLDCVSNNPRLNQFYRECGFNFIGYSNGFNKYEKQL